MLSVEWVEMVRPCTDQHVLLWAEDQLPAGGGHLLFTLLLVTGSVVPTGPTLRHEEGPGDQDPEVVQDFRGVDQFQMAGGKPVTQHLGPREEGWAWCIPSQSSGWGSGKGIHDLKDPQARGRSKSFGWCRVTSYSPHSRDFPG